MGKFYILVAVLAVSNLALTDSVDEAPNSNNISPNGLVTTKACNGGGKGSEAKFYVDGCDGAKCNIEEGKKYNMYGNWKYGSEQTGFLYAKLSSTIKGDLGGTHILMNDISWNPGSNLEKGQKYWINKTFELPPLKFDEQDIVVKWEMLRMVDENELCVEANFRLNGAPLLLVPAVVLLSFQVLLRLF